VVSGQSKIVNRLKLQIEYPQITQIFTNNKLCLSEKSVYKL